MRKFIILTALVLVACLTFAVLSARPVQSQKMENEDVIVQKLDEILKNQAEMFEYLKFIKNRSR